jgi:HTH-type transcriptional regulator/antitoxin HipB
LRALRKQRGLTQAQLGERMGLGQTRIAEIEARPGSISVDQLFQILSVLRASLMLRDLEGDASSTALAEPAARAVSAAAKKRVPRAKPAAPAFVIPPKKGTW